MEDLKALVKRLITYKSEEEWFEFKDNWFDAVGIGEYISSLSNTAAMLGKENAYLIWGMDNDTHELTNTTFDFQKDVKNEPLKHFLARQIVPDLRFEFKELTFRKLFLYYEDKGIVLNKKTFKKNLGLLTTNGKYNLLAQLLSDDSHIPVRVSIFRGTDKTSPLYSVREFGNSCLLISLDKVLEYGDVLNIMQADETDRIVERKEVPLFNPNAFREAIINAFVHNLWVDGNAPMITVYSDRIEILSRGTLVPAQTIEGFYLGESVPVNKTLSDIFFQLHISERSGRGVPVITGVYGKDAFEFREHSIVVTIPFEHLSLKVGNKVENKKLNSTHQRILQEMRNNPNITQEQLMLAIGIGKTKVFS